MNKKNRIIIVSIILVVIILVVSFVFLKKDNNNYSYNTDDNYSEITDDDGVIYLRMQIGDKERLIDVLELDSYNNIVIVSNSNDLVASIDDNFFITGLTDGNSDIIINVDGTLYELYVVVNNVESMASVKSDFYDLTLSSKPCRKIADGSKIFICANYPLNYVGDNGKIRNWWIQDFAITDKYIYFSGPTKGMESISDIPIDSNKVEKLLSGKLKESERKSFLGTYYNIMKNNKYVNNISLTRVVRVPRGKEIKPYYKKNGVVQNPSEIKTMYIRYGGHGHIDVLNSGNEKDILYMNSAAALNYIKSKNGYRASHKAITYTNFNEEEGLVVPNNYIFIKKGGNKLYKLSQGNKNVEELYNKLINEGTQNSYLGSPDMAVDNKTNRIALVSIGKAYIYNLSSFNQGKVSDKKIFNVEYKIKMNNNTVSKSNVALDNKYLYILYSKPQHLNSIYKYNIDSGKLVGSVNFDLKSYFDKISTSNRSIIETEAISVYNGKVYVVVNFTDKYSDGKIKKRYESIFRIDNI